MSESTTYVESGEALSTPATKEWRICAAPAGADSSPSVPPGEYGHA